MPDNTSQTQITPESTLDELLRSYPRLEAMLAEISPSFRALTSPALREAVVKATSVRQVAEAGRIPLGELIGKLRCAAGLEASEPEAAAPAWAAASRVVQTLDARPIIAAGGHPLGQVMSDLERLGAGQVYELLTPFVPAPLVEIANGKGFQAFSSRETPNLVRTYFAKL